MSHEYSPALRTIALTHPTPAKRYWQACALVAEQHAAQWHAAYTSAADRAQVAERAHARERERTRDAIKYVETGTAIGQKMKEAQRRKEEVERELAMTRNALVDEMRRNSELRRRVEELEGEKEVTQEAVGHALGLVEAALARRKARSEEHAREGL